MTAPRLNGKVAVVTGSGRDLRRAHAIALGRAGAAVVVTMSIGTPPWLRLS